MKRIVFLILILAVIGGAAAGWMKFGMMKRGKGGKKTAKAIKPAPPVTPPSVSATPAAADEAKSKSAENRTEAAPKGAPPPAQTVAPNKAPDPDAERKIARLTSVYEQMAPEDAGRVLAKLPDPLVTQMFRRMDERQVGKILLTFGADRAARLTQALSR